MSERTLDYRRMAIFVAVLIMLACGRVLSTRVHAQCIPDCCPGFCGYDDQRISMFDLRILGMAKGLPVAALKRLLPWGVFGFILCVVTGLTFVTGIRANVSSAPYDVIRTNIWLQLKLVFIVLAGVNLAAFYLTGMSRAADDLRPGSDAPLLAKAIAGASLFLWLGVIYFGRLIPEGL